MSHPVQLPTYVAWGIFIVGCIAIWINYEADVQRQRVRETSGIPNKKTFFFLLTFTPGNTLVWGQKPKILLAKYRTTTGEEKTSQLLYSGWWGVARHFHYVPELVSLKKKKKKKKHTKKTPPLSSWPHFAGVCLLCLTTFLFPTFTSCFCCFC
jgi:hypothetical protein